MTVILPPDQKGQSPKMRLLPSKVPVLAQRRQISVGSSFRARFPHPAQLSSLREPGTQPKWRLVFSGCPKRETRAHRLQPIETATAIRLQRQGQGRGSLLPQGLGQSYWRALVKGSGDLQHVVSSLFPGASSSLTGPRLGKLEGLQEKA